MLAARTSYCPLHVDPTFSIVEKLFSPLSFLTFVSFCTSALFNMILFNISVLHCNV